MEIEHPLQTYDKVTPLIPTITKGANRKTSVKTDLSVFSQKTIDDPIKKNRRNYDLFFDLTYDFREFMRAEDVDGYIATTFRLTVEQCLKSGFEFVGPNTELVDTIELGIKQILHNSGSHLDEFIENIVTGATKFSNAMCVFVRKPPTAGSPFKTYQHRGKTLQPIAGMFYVEPQHMRPFRQFGQLIYWVYYNLDTGAVRTNFDLWNVFHTKWNRKGDHMFGTPWVLPALDDVRMLRRLEEFAQMLISKHLFPLYQYKIGTEKQPAMILENGTSEVISVQSQVGELPTQGCIFTSHRHEVIAINQNASIMDIKDYIQHFDRRAKSSCGLSDIDLGVGDTANRGCHDESTETLTETGWKHHWEINHEVEKIATFNPDTQLIEYHVPTGKWLEFYEGPMHRYKAASLDMLVTPDHKMWWKLCAQDNSQFVKTKSEDISSNRVNFVDVCSTTNLPDTDKDENIVLPFVASDHRQGNKYDYQVSINKTVLAEFVGYFVSEGCLVRHKGRTSNSIALHQMPGVKANKIIECLDKLGIGYTTVTKDDGCLRWTITNPSLYTFLKECGCRAKNKRIPSMLMQSGKTVTQALFDAAMLGDGTRDKREGRSSGAFYSTSIELANQMQVLATKLGYRAKFREHKLSRSGNMIYRVILDFTPSLLQVRLDQMRTTEDYSGYVYCYEVPNHLFITRRNGIITIQGNTATTLNQMREDRCLRIQRNIEADFREQIIVPMLLSLGLDPFKPENQVQFKFRPINSSEKRAQETHALSMFQGGLHTHDEARAHIGKRAFTTPAEWDNTHANTVARVLAQHGTQSKIDQAAGKAALNTGSPSNQHGKKPKARVAKNDELDQEELTLDSDTENNTIARVEL